MTQDLDNPRRDRPDSLEADETYFEVTPEMIEAGVAALAAFNPEFESEESCIRRIWEAMFSQRTPAEP